MHNFQNSWKTFYEYVTFIISTIWYYKKNMIVVLNILSSNWTVLNYIGTYLHTVVAPLSHRCRRGLLRSIFLYSFLCIFVSSLCGHCAVNKIFIYLFLSWLFRSGSVTTPWNCWIVLRKYTPATWIPPQNAIRMFTWSCLML